MKRSNTDQRRSLLLLSSLALFVVFYSGLVRAASPLQQKKNKKIWASSACTVVHALRQRQPAAFVTTARTASRQRHFPNLISVSNTRSRSAILSFSPKGNQLRDYPLSQETFAITTLFLARNRGAKQQKQSRKYSSSGPTKMPRGVKKEHLPSKICVTCGRPFTWRKKWEKVWDEVTTCSKSCNHKRRLAKREDKTEGEQDQNEDVASIQSDRNTDTHKVKVKGQRRSISSVASEFSYEKEEGNLASEFEGNLSLLLNGNGFTNEEERSSVDGIVEDQEEDEIDPMAKQKAERKASKKIKKAERRAQREGRGDPTAGQKECDMCHKSVDLLIRCKYEEGQLDWSMVCGKCWKVASGGVVDGDDQHPHYRYGGLWKNRRAQK